MVLQSLKDSGEAAGEVSSMYSTPNASSLRATEGAKRQADACKDKGRAEVQSAYISYRPPDTLLTPWQS